MRKWNMQGGIVASLLSNFFGPKLYTETNVYKNAQTALALSLMYPEQSSQLRFSNPVLAAFANAMWHCKSAAEVCTVLNEAAAKAGQLKRDAGLEAVHQASDAPTPVAKSPQPVSSSWDQLIRDFAALIRQTLTSLSNSGSPLRAAMTVQPSMSGIMMSSVMATGRIAPRAT